MYPYTPSMSVCVCLCLRLCVCVCVCLCVCVLACPLREIVIEIKSLIMNLNLNENKDVIPKQYATVENKQLFTEIRRKPTLSLALGRLPCCCEGAQPLVNVPFVVK